MEKVKPSAERIFLGLVIFLLIGNYLSAMWWHYPFLYCGLKPIVEVIWEPSELFLKLGAIGLLIYKGLGKDSFGTFRACVILLVVYSLPQWIDITFRMGGSCG